MAQTVTPDKFPTNTVGCDTIDIFVFSNGQQYSPPRKYHLRTEELSRWKATLNYLARSQYGSLHSIIDLYTMDGKKLDNSVQLQNGVAYVAVEPPEPFIDTGYDKYLIKASRSWEKRQLRKNSSCEINKQAEVNINIDSKLEIKSECKKHSIDMKTLDENPNRTTIMRNTDEQTSMKVKPRVSTDSQPTNRRTSNNSNIQKANEKKHPTIIKNKNTNLIVSPLVSRRTSFKRRNSPPRRINNSKTVKAIDKPVISDTLDKEPFRSKARTSYKTKNTLPTIQGSRADEVTMEKSTPKLETKLAPIKFSSKTQNNLLENAHTKTVIVNRVDETNLYKNPEKELPSIIVDTDINAVKLREKEIEQVLNDSLRKGIVETLLDQVEKHLTEQTTNQTLKVDRSDNTSQPFTCDQCVACNNLGEDNYTAVINKGDVINLKLKIKVTNADNHNTKSILKCTSHSVTNSIKIEKTLQVNSDDNIFIQRKSLQSIPASEFTQVDGNNKVIVVHCHCYDKCDDIPQINTQDNKHIILVTNSKLNENAMRCECSQVEKKIETINLKTNSAEQNHNIHPLNKTFSSISIERLTKLNAETSLITHRDIEMPTDEINCVTSQCDVSIKRKADTAKVQEENSQCMKVKNDASKLVEDGTKSGYVETMANAFGASPMNFVEKATQTEWCNILLEARCQGNGRYSFHLPPLHVLKYYELYS